MAYALIFLAYLLIGCIYGGWKAAAECRKAQQDFDVLTALIFSLAWIVAVLWSIGMAIEERQSRRRIRLAGEGDRPRVLRPWFPSVRMLRPRDKTAA